MVRQRLFIVALGCAGLTLFALTLALATFRASAQSGEYPYRSIVPLVSKGSGVPTAAPTLAATVAPTQAPTTIPTVGPTPNPQTVFLRNFTAYEDSLDAIWIVGEVVNPYPFPVEFVEITARYFSASGTLLATDFTYSDLLTIPAGSDSPFSVLLFDPPPGIATYDLVITDFDTDIFFPAPVGLTAQVTNSYIDGIGIRHDVGIVTNNSGFTYEFTQIYIAYYNAAGQVIRTDFTYADPDLLGPGQSGTFEVLEWDGDTLPIASYRIWVDASYE